MKFKEFLYEQLYHSEIYVYTSDANAFNINEEIITPDMYDPAPFEEHVKEIVEGEFDKEYDIVKYSDDIYIAYSTDELPYLSRKIETLVSKYRNKRDFDEYTISDAIDDEIDNLFKKSDVYFLIVSKISLNKQKILTLISYIKDIILDELENYR